MSYADITGKSSFVVSFNCVDDMPGVVTLKKAKTTCTSYGPGTSKSVTLCETDSPSHCWPGQGAMQCGTEVVNALLVGARRTLEFDSRVDDCTIYPASM